MSVLERPCVEGIVKKASFQKALFALVTVLSVAGTSFAQTPKQDDAKARQERVENGLEPVDLGGGQPPVKLSLADLMNAFKDPGLTVAVIDGYKIVWAKAYGVTDYESKTPVTTKTLFQAGSISKPVAATGMMAMVQQGKLALDEDVNLKLKTWKVPENEFTKKEKVTLRRLASHTAGLTVHGFPGYDVDEKIPTLVEILNGTKPPANTAEIRVDFVPGTKWRYSGGGVTIEQLLMTDVSGKPFPALMKELVLEREGMTDSSYEQPLPAAWQARAATGTNASGKAIHGKWHIYPEMAAAGLWTTPTDLAKFVIDIALSKQGKSNKTLTQKSISEMLTHPPSAPDFGIGFAVSADHAGEFGHDGADEGFQALLLMNYETGQGFAAMANSDHGIFVAHEFLRSVAKEYGWKYGQESRGSAERLLLVLNLRSADAALAAYDDAAKTKKPEEFLLNMIGYTLLSEGKTDDAIKAFAKNTQMYPESGNVYDSLGEAYAAAGKKELAIENYEKSLKLDPKNTNAVEWLKKLKEQK
jgi:CubicO group peptidase (beta-lactamase class C family)